MRTVSTRALIARINRHLKAEEETVRKTRPGGWPRADFGEYYFLDWRRNCATAKHVDLETYAREANLLKPHEQVEQAD